MTARRFRQSRALRLAVALGCAALAAGCVVGPDFHRPGAPANAGYAPAPLAPATEATDIAAGASQRLVSGRDLPFEWWREFGSPALNALVERSFRHNPTIAAAQAALTQAQELVYAQRGFYYPTVGATYQLERHKIAGNLTNDQAPGVQGNGDNLLAPLQDPLHYPHTAPLFYTFHTLELTVGFVPDLLGANRRQVESLAAQADVERFALEATYITLASNVVAAAVQEAELRAQIEATEELIAAAARALGILQHQLRAGAASRIDVAAQESALAQARATLPPLRKQFEQTRDLLRALAGTLPNEELGERFTLDALRLPEELPLSLPAQVIEQRPDVRAAEAQLHAANAEVGVAVAAMLPQFSITGSVGGNATQIPWLFRSGGSFWNLIGDVTQPLFQGGTLLHRKRAADAALRQAAAQYQGTVIAAYQNVADTLHAALADAQTLHAAHEAEQAASVTLELTRRQLDAGFVDGLALINAETSLLGARLARIQAQATRFGDTVALYQSLGGGWWHRAESVAER